MTNLTQKKECRAHHDSILPFESYGLTPGVFTKWHEVTRFDFVCLVLESSFYAIIVKRGKHSQKKRETPQVELSSAGGGEGGKEW